MTSDGETLDLLLDRLAAAELPTLTADLVLAAALGDDELDSALSGNRPIRPALASEQPPRPAMYLTRIAVTGFRGIAGEAFLGLRPGPGLTLVVGRNGSGKSSFAEAAELTLTGTSSRWSRRSHVWEEGWANLHHHGSRSVEVRAAFDGVSGETILRRSWAAGAELDEGIATAQHPGQPTMPLQGLGLDQALATWRPFLSYNELGGLLDDGPSRLYDAVSAALGLEEWVQAEQHLIARRKDLDAVMKTARSEAERLRGLLAGMNDERARQALAALPARKSWDLAVIEALSTGEGRPAPDQQALESLAAMPELDVDEIGRRAEALRSAVGDVESLRKSASAHARSVADLLERARVWHHDRRDRTCPVCGTAGALDEAWEEFAAAEIVRLREEAAAADQASTALDGALAAARSLVTQVAAVPRTVVDGVDTSVLDTATRRWAAAPTEPAGLAAHLESVGLDLAAAIDDVRAASMAELRRRQDLWRPIAAQLAAWLPMARAAQAAGTKVGHLKAAASWLAAETTAVRNERFEPIADQVKQLWDALKFTSNVSLDAVTLEGTRTRRRVELLVTVDHVEGAALSVMSQGELHCLALSLFLPRATLAGSPFRFLVIDDPVQAMDANRVDGLANVLAQAARTHQVIVFTHDERLPAAARRLGIAATVLEVTRGLDSNLTVRSRANPIDDYLSDARAVLATKNIPEAARRRVVPGLCRNALEVACAETTTRRLLLEGRPHAQVELDLDSAGKLLPRIALALFGDAGRAGDVLGDVNRRWGTHAGDCVKALQRGAHQLIDSDPTWLVNETARIAYGVLELA